MKGSASSASLEQFCLLKGIWKSGKCALAKLSTEAEQYPLYREPPMLFFHRHFPNPDLRTNPSATHRMNAWDWPLCIRKMKIDSRLRNIGKRGPRRGCEKRSNCSPAKRRDASCAPMPK